MPAGRVPACGGHGDGDQGAQHHRGCPTLLAASGGRAGVDHIVSDTPQGLVVGPGGTDVAATHAFEVGFRRTQLGVRVRHGRCGQGVEEGTDVFQVGGGDVVVALGQDEEGVLHDERRLTTYSGRAGACGQWSGGRVVGSAVGEARPDAGQREVGGEPSAAEPDGLACRVAIAGQGDGVAGDVSGGSGPFDAMASRLPDGNTQNLQQFVSASTWDPVPVRRRIAERLLPLVRADAWAVDDVSFPKDGRMSVGVAPQYCGALGKQANCRVAVSVHAVSDSASCPIQWRLFLPPEWDADADRRRRTGVPDVVRHREKWQLALDALDEAAAWGMRPPVVVADAAYGQNALFRAGLTERGLDHVVAIRADAVVHPVCAVPTTLAGAGAGRGRGRSARRRRGIARRPWAWPRSRRRTAVTPSPTSPGGTARAARCARGSCGCGCDRPAGRWAAWPARRPGPTAGRGTVSCPRRACWSNGPTGPNTPPITGCSTCRRRRRRRRWCGWRRSGGGSSTTTAR
ncbi:IS701 family transposase [Embleya sp. MST-111070]|uniref:IS701 family transposase n=1 Tax=Embleya sp. MST-111070 TaxID=3398231 RepID=UPI003F7382AE